MSIFARLSNFSTSTGTGSLTLGAAEAGFRSIGNLTSGTTLQIAIEAVDGSGVPTGDFEWCESVFTSPDQLSRGTLIASSTGSRINFAAGTKRIFAVAVPAAGAAGQVQYNSGGALGGADNVAIENGNLRLPAIATPAAPAAGGLNLYSTALGGRILPTWLGPSGLSSRAQPFFGSNRIGWAVPLGTGTTLNLNGLSSVTAVGTGTTSAVATTNLYTSMRRLEYLVTTAATTAVAGVRIAASMFFRGNGTAGVGGYHLVTRGGPATGPSTTAGTLRMFMGMGPNANPTDVNPSTLTNIIGIGCDSTDANLQLMHNDGTGTATKTDLGSSFPKPTVDRTDVYEVALFTPPNGSTVQWQVTNLTTGATASGTISTDMPAASQLLTPYNYVSVGGTNSVVGFNLVGIYVEVDN